jgi:hypothetical protein
MSTQLRHLKFLNEYAYFRAQTKFKQAAQAGARDLLNSEELTAIKAKCPKDK